MKIYINDFTTPVKAEILPSNAPTLDETLETFSFALLSTDKSLGASQIAPMQKVKVEFENATNDVAYFYIVSDSVEIFSTNPVRYKHNISCVQNTRELSKHLVRNSSFTQPAQPYKESFNSVMGCYFFGDTSHRYFVRYGNNNPSYPLNVYSQPLAISNREKVKSLKIRIEMKVAKYNANGSEDIDNGDTTWDLPLTKSNIYFPSGLTPSFFNSLALVYKINNVSTTETLSPSMLYKNGVALSEFEFNQDLDCPYISNLINNQNATDLELKFNGLPIICDGYLTMTSVDGCVVCYITTLKIVAETYYYNCYDILDLLIKRQQKSTSIKTDAPLFILPQDNANYNQNQRELARLLKNTIAPNFYFTQLTMYECVADVFRLFDAIFNMDENGVLGIEYFNDLSGEIITPKLTGKNESISEDKYTNGLDVFYQDARTTESFPSKGNYAHVRCDHVGIPQPSEFYFITPHNIHSIKSFETFRNLASIVYVNGTSKQIPSKNSINIDLSRFIVDYELWSELDVGTPTNAEIYKQLQANTIFFQKGTNKINLAESVSTSWGLNAYNFNYMMTSAVSSLFGAPFSFVNTNVPDWKSILLRCDYTTTIDGKLRVESLEYKYNGETLVDQSNGAVDLNKLGLNILGLSLKLGQPTLNATHKITTWDNRIKIGQIYNYEGGTWIANVCSYTILGNGYLQGQVSFVKNFNQLALRTQILREKRMSNISNELITKSEDIICDYLYLSSEYKNNISIQDVHFNKNYVYSAIKNSFKNDGISLNKIKFASIYTGEIPERRAAYASSGTIFEESPGWRSELNITVPLSTQYPLRRINVTLNGQPYAQYSYTNELNYISFIVNALDERDFDYILIEVFCYKEWDGIYLPLVKYGAGNTLCFEMSFDSPMLSGLQTNNGSGWFGTSNYFTKGIKYTDAEGFRDEFDIKITDDYEKNEFPREFPSIPLGDSQVINIDNYSVYKQPNEIFALNYEIVLLAVDYTVDFIGSKLINENFLVTSETPINQELRLYYTTDSDNDSFQYSVLDTEGHEGHYTAITSVSQSGNAVTFNFAAITNLKTWAICDSNGKIYFASNRAFSGSKSFVVLYLYARNSRIDEFTLY